MYGRARNRDCFLTLNYKFVEIAWRASNLIGFSSVKFFLHGMSNWLLSFISYFCITFLGIVTIKEFILGFENFSSVFRGPCFVTDHEDYLYPRRFSYLVNDSKNLFTYPRLILLSLNLKILFRDLQYYTAHCSCTDLFWIILSASMNPSKLLSFHNVRMFLSMFRL